jgi:hypothetical protein
MNQQSLNNNKIARNFTIKEDQRDDFFHSSGYGAAQNSGNIGTASTGLTMSERKNIEEKRQFVKKYNNSQIFSSTLNLRHSKPYVPTNSSSSSNSNYTNTGGEYTATASSNTATPPANTRPITRDLAGSGNGIGSSNSFTPYRTGGSAAAGAPRPSRSFTPNIKPNFK